MMKFVEQSTDVEPDVRVTETSQTKNPRKTFQMEVLGAILEGILENNHPQQVRLNEGTSVDAVISKLDDEVNEDKLGAAVTLLEEDNLIELNQTLGGGTKLGSISHITLTESGIFDLGKHKFPQWPFVKFDIAKALQDGDRLLPELSDRVNLPAPFVHAFLRHFDQRGMIMLSETNMKVQATHIDPSLEEIGNRGELDV
jgi:hypothetical protein